MAKAAKVRCGAMLGRGSVKGGQCRMETAKRNDDGEPRCGRHGGIRILERSLGS